MQSALADVAQALLLPGTVGTAVGEVVGSLVGALRERRQIVRALSGCRRLADLLEAEPDLDALSYYPHLLAWEIARLPGERVVPVVLLDTFEDVGDRTRREMERLVQRVVWLMPNALFVITGRSRLEWADDELAGQLDYTGPAAWPHLADPAPAPAVPGPRAARSAGAPERQVLIGDFSPEDCDRYLARRLTRSGEPLVDAGLRRLISDRSHGLPLYLDLAVMRVLQLRRTGRTPAPADFDADFPALISRTLQDLTPDERHVLRSVTLLDSFDLALATHASGLPHEAAALRLVERPFISHHPFGLWPYHLHALIRSTLRTAADPTDDRWSAADWQHAAERALAALGEQWDTNPRDRRLLVGCLRQGLALARDFRLAPGWLTDAAFAYISDSVWEPVTLAAPLPMTTGGRRDPDDAGTVTPSEAILELLATLARRQHEHRRHTVDRLTRLLAAEPLGDDLAEMALYYRAKARRDIGSRDASRRDYQRVADRGGRLAPAARRGLAQAARLAGDFPAAHTAARQLGWEGRHQRVLGDLYWVQGEPERAAAAYLAGRTEAEQHAVRGEAAHNQAMRAFSVAFTDPRQADDELDLARHLLTGLHLRATTVNTRIAALIRDAGHDTVPDRVPALRAELEVAGLTSMAPTLELAVAFHQAVVNDHTALAATLSRLRDLTRGGDYGYYVDIAHFLGHMPHEDASRARWLDGEERTSGRWRGLVVARQTQLRAGR
ncbi:ATP/GTP-binding protein [Streptomyces tendae]|uniref:ATP/GTP-binding protein n=1 Tax=Streptomyces tendae TaxID=1932 RepID=UPI0037BC57D8